MANNIRHLLSFNRLADLFVPTLRNSLNGIAGRSQAHAVLAYTYIEDEVLPALLALYRLSKEEAEAQAAAKGGEQS